MGLYDKQCVMFGWFDLLDWFAEWVGLTLGGFDLPITVSWVDLLDGFALPISVG
jgi:hypothetical protein